MEQKRRQNTKVTRYKHKIGIQDRNARYVCVKMEGMHIQNRNDADIQMEDMRI